MQDILNEFLCFQLPRGKADVISLTLCNALTKFWEKLEVRVNYLFN